MHNPSVDSKKQTVAIIEEALKNIQLITHLSDNDMRETFKDMYAMKNQMKFDILVTDIVKDLKMAHKK